MRVTALAAVAVLLALVRLSAEVSGGEGANVYARWRNGPPHDPGFFAVGVWLQNPKNAWRYKRIGINLYVGLWKGPTEEQLALLRRAGMPVVCDQNEVGLRHKDDRTIVGWINLHEPDNAQPIGKGKYGPPIPPWKVVQRYKMLKANDPTRPVVLVLGQGVAWDGWWGRGVRTGHPEDYPEYLKGCDIAFFDIYPVTHPSPQVAGKLWFVARGVDRIKKWTGGKKIIWAAIECTHINNPRAKPTPHQVRAEVWMAIIHGAMGIVYFAHEFKPRFNEHALLDDPVMREAVGRINWQIHELAPVLNSPSVKGLVEAKVSPPEAPVDFMVKRHKGSLYIFAVCMRDASATAVFTVKGLKGAKTVEVLGEGRRIKAEGGSFSDRFGPYDVHIYRVGFEP